MAKLVQSQNLSAIKAPQLIRRTTPAGSRTHKGIWRCHCGNEFEASLNNVSRGHTKSCGCHATEARKASYPTHGHFVGGKPSPTYKSWQAMIARCTNPKHPAYARYGGRGIAICPQWLASFEAFLADVGERPAGKTLDRKDPNKNYNPDNWQWSTPKQQQHNRADSMMVEIDGARMSVGQACEKTGCLIAPGRVANRLRQGWSLADAMSRPLGK